MSRLTLALEELEENRREEEQFNNIGAKWKQVAKIIDRLINTIENSIGGLNKLL